MSHSFGRHYIGGVWREPSSPGRIAVTSPVTFERIAEVPDGTPEDADAAVRAARLAQPQWAAVPMGERIALMEKMLGIFRTCADEIVRLEALELGAPVSFSKVSHCEYQFTRTASYIRLAGQIPESVPFEASTVLREPVGVVACITPWNYPLGQVVQKVIPALLMGNTVVLKPSQHTPLTAFLLIEAFDRAGFPAGVINLVSGRGSRLGPVLAAHPLVDMVSFTGSTAVGTELARTALASVKRISLELGGKSPCVWLPMKDYAPALPGLMNSIFLNSGQTCTALSRLIVPEDDLPAIEAMLREALKRYPVGDPFDPATRIGPVASRAQFDKVSSYIRLGIEEGARLVAGGVPAAPDRGYFIAPTIFSDVRNDMRIAQEEIFGPVLCILTYRTVDEAVAIANDTRYGLNAAVFGPKAEAVAVARRIRAGNVYVNDGPRDVTAPFGGYKASGIGREGGIHGLMEFTQLKAIFDRGVL